MEVVASGISLVGCWRGFGTCGDVTQDRNCEQNFHFRFAGCVGFPPLCLALNCLLFSCLVLISSIAIFFYRHILCHFLFASCSLRHELLFIVNVGSLDLDASRAVCPLVYSKMRLLATIMRISCTAPCRMAICIAVILHLRFFGLHFALNECPFANCRPWVQ